MRRLISVFMLLLISLPTFGVDKKLAEVKRRWKPAVFKSFVMGKTTFRDLVIAYPHPSEVGYWSVSKGDGFGQDSDITPTRYEVLIDGATYQFEIRKGLVQRVWSPLDSLRDSENHFGNNYIEI